MANKKKTEALQKPAKREKGRPEKYKKEYDAIAEKVCEQFGADDKQLAETFGVCKATITVWKKEYPDFLASVRKGKDVYDVKNVEKGLINRAEGYEYEEVHSEVVEGADGKKKKQIKKVKKHLAPDPTSMIFYLCNRNKERWKHVQRVELSGPGGGPLKTENTTITGEMSEKEAAAAYARMVKNSENN